MSQTCSQLLATIDRNCKSSSVSFPTADKIAEMNIAMDDAFAIIFKAAGRWQFDDSNHEDYPFIMTTIEVGKRDYSFTTDEQGNLILDVYKVMIKRSVDGPYEQLYPVDQQSDHNTESFYDGMDVAGTVTSYDKTANAIFLDYLPDTEIVDGLKVFINREGSYFNTSDTTKMPGFAGLFHGYVALKPSYRHASTNGLTNKNDLKQDIIDMESSMRKWYRDRSRDEQQSFQPPQINSM